MRKSIFLIALLFFVFKTISFFSNSDEKEKIKEQQRVEKKEKYKKMFYKPDYHKWWASYKPNLVNSEGWVSGKCKKYENEKVIVLRQNLKHVSKGYHKGKLRVKIIKTGEITRIDYQCYKPDYSKGKWLNNEYRIK